MVEGLGDDLDLARLAESVPETEDLLEQEDDAPIIRLINALLSEAIREDASDIHIETFERDLLVRFRVDGVLREAVRPKRAVASLLVSRIKGDAKLTRRQSGSPGGRIALRIGGREGRCARSTLPSATGTRVVPAAARQAGGSPHAANLGMRTDVLERLREVCTPPHGISW